MRESDPSQGYVMDTTYARTFFRELSPVWLNYVAALRGASPRALDRPFTYLELGCGFGGSTVVHAAALPHGEFHACDVNPVHVAGGRRHAAALGVRNARFHEASFGALQAFDLPPFDFIVLHGVYSWVGIDARRTIRRIIRDHLKPGGLVYLSYNCLPGWSTEVPLRKLLLELAATENGGAPHRTRQALRSLTELCGSELRYFSTNPSAATAVRSYVGASSDYLAHEFLSATWEPFYSIDVADEMAEAQVRYVGSATLVDNHPMLVVDAQAADAIANLPTARQRQLAIDFATNRRFRRDVFVRAPERPSPVDAARHLAAVVVGSLGDPERIGTSAAIPRGALRLQDDFVRALRAEIERGPIPIGELVAALAGRRRDGRDPTHVTRNLTFLVAAGVLTPFAKAHRPNVAAGRGRLRPSSATVERALAYVLDRGEPSPIPSEVLGSGVPIQPAEAFGIVQTLAGATDVDTSAARLVPTFVRLGLLT